VGREEPPATEEGGEAAGHVGHPFGGAYGGMPSTVDSEPARDAEGGSASSPGEETVRTRGGRLKGIARSPPAADGVSQRPLLTVSACV